MNNYLYSNDSYKCHSNLQFIELKNQAILVHENYLRIDDNEQRDDYRKKLHKFIVEYLMKIPHSNKFILKDFYFIIDNCIEKNDEFNPLKAAESFNHLFTIINNLILKPWRKEYHKICVYNAYLKYLISQQIPHYDHILKLIGYESKNKNGILNYYLTKRVSQDILKLISFDCFISYVEFRYFHQFGELLKNKNIQPNWSFLYKLRKKYTGDFESTLDNYLHIYRDQIEFKKNDAEEQINKKYKHLSNLISKYEENLNRNSKVNGNLIDLDNLTQPVNNYDDLDNILNSSINSVNGSSAHSAVSRPTSTYNHQPIKLKGNYINHEVTNSNNYLQCSDGFPPRPEETDLDQVDFIDSELNNSINNLKNDLNSKIKYLDNNAQKLESCLKSENDKIPSNSLMNGKSNSLDKKITKTSKPVEKKYSTLDYKSSKDKNSTNSKLSKSSKWQCKHCTFLNEKTDQICKICSKSMKSLTSSKNDHMNILGGKECNLCSFVNKKNELNCQMCANSLANSPTYI